MDIYVIDIVEDDNAQFTKLFTTHQYEASC